MKNNKAFTLVELIAVIAILALILALVVPKVFKTIDESKKRACNIQMEYITDAAATYFTKYRYNSITANSSITYDAAAKEQAGVDVTLLQLNSASLLKGTITNPVNDEVLSLTGTVVNIKNNNGVFSYTILVQDELTLSWNQITCE